MQEKARMKISLDPYGVQGKRSRVAAGSSLARPMPILQPHVAAAEASDATEVPVWKRTLDLVYARKKSPWLDLKIMARTVAVLVSQVGEARRRTGEASESPAPGRKTGGWGHEPRRA